METVPPQGSSSPQPAQIGPYKILELLGEGGMGSVYLGTWFMVMVVRLAGSAVLTMRCWRRWSRTRS